MGDHALAGGRAGKGEEAQKGRDAHGNALRWAMGIGGMPCVLTAMRRACPPGAWRVGGINDEWPLMRTHSSIRPWARRDDFLYCPASSAISAALSALL